MNRNVVFALLAAALFGASTPFAKLLVGNLPPILLAGLLYLGSGIGLWGSCLDGSTAAYSLVEPISFLRS